jgi:NitT/TauT family transport system permease protein
LITRYTLSREQVIERTWPVFLDLLIGATVLAFFFAVINIAQDWMGKPVPAVVISSSVRMLPVYAYYSLVRIWAAYLLSLIFAVGYGYIAVYNKRAETLMIAVLDILQSIPVLSFLPGVMLAMMALIPGHQLGIEMGAILLIFTGQVWNMAFSFYSSLKSIPREMIEASRVYRFSAWQRFWQLELPYATIGLVWNSMVSVAGGWFFLMACEMFVLGDRDFRLPGLGSYLQTAASNGDTRAMISGLVMMILIIVVTDQLLWRPVIAWSNKFKFEQTESDERVTSPILTLLRKSNLLAGITKRTITPIGEDIYQRLAHIESNRHIHPIEDDDVKKRPGLLTIFLSVVGVCVVLYAALQAVGMLRQVSLPAIVVLLEGAGATLLRVYASLILAVLWTVPVGVAIGLNPKLAHYAQPIVQIVASIPAPALFPVLLLALIKMGGGLTVGSIALMLLGAQWYILFNVIAGAMAIPSDLKEVAAIYRFTKVQRWKQLILPGIFPYLITGLITASGGAWNASIIAEYFHLQGKVQQTLGLGQQISAATDSGNFPLLLMATTIMALIVVTINRLLWRRLYRLAELRYKLEG